MTNSGDFSVSAVQRKRAGEPGALPSETEAPAPAAPAAPGPAPAAVGFSLPVDPLRLLLAVGRKFWLVLLAGLVCAAPAGVFGWRKFQTSFTVTVQLIRRELSNSFRASELGEAFKPRQLSTPTIVSIMRSPSLLAKVGAQAKPRLSGSELSGGLTITPEKNTDLITITLITRSSAPATVDAINLYAQGVVDLTKTLQQQEASELDHFLRDQLAKADTELAGVNQEILDFSRETKFYSSEKEIEAYLRELGEADARLRATKLEQETIAFRIASLERELIRQDPTLLKLSDARGELKTLMARYTQRNPLVAEQQEKIALLEREVAASTNRVEDFQPGLNSVANSMFIDLISLKAQREALAKQSAPMETQLKEVQAKLDALPDKTVRYARLKGRQEALVTTRTLLAGRQREAQLFAENSLGYYRLFASATPSDVEVSSKTKKTAIIAVGALMLGLGLAFLGLCAREALDARVVSPADMRRAAGAPVLARLGDLAALNAEALARWRFATWSTLFRALGNPANRSLVAGITSATPGEGRSTWLGLLAAAAAERDFRTLTVTHGPPVPGTATIMPLEQALAEPARVTRLLETSPQVQLECPADWTWSAERRARWALALRHWQALPRLALLVEIPPATRLDAVMLAETLPHLLWLSRSGAVEQDEVTPVIKTLRASEAHLSGVLANALPAIFGKLPDLSRFGLALAFWLGLAANALAADPAAAPAADATNGFLSATAAGPKLAPWQQRLTLGAGDLVNLTIYGRKEATRTLVPLGPDGRISYLQAEGVLAAGLTIDELRARLNQELSQYYQSAQVIVTPAEYRSKRYFLLGSVMDRGAYVLDRPTTIIEAVARARGIATGLLEQNTVEIADLPRALLVRDGQRLPVDFVKLFRDGDLSQNVALAPDDYLYFPSSTLNEAYVLGAVSSPGTVGVTDQSSVVSLITTRGGFTEKAYRQRVLVVRGALSKPETFVVNVAAILRGKGLDFMLKPKDIVFVADRPWVRAEELLDMAIGSFTSAVVTSLANKAVPTRGTGTTTTK
jgi:protein involved in polysaccharide export with SLBB domain/capsular polysaccharide biosynthesis protein